MRRYSLAWWSAILPTSLIAGAAAFLVLRQFFNLDLIDSIVGAAFVALLIDLAIAAWMEKIAPTRVTVGPGEKRARSDEDAERATVIGGFGASAHGRVRVRGEIWPAIRRPQESGKLSIGAVVRVVDRIGLRLVVAAPQGSG